MLLRLTSNSGSSYLNLPISHLTDMCHHVYIHFYYFIINHYTTAFLAHLNVFILIHLCVFANFSYNIFLSYSFTSNSSQILSTSLPNQLHAFSLSQKEKIETKVKTIRQNNKTKTKQKNSEKNTPMESVLCCLTTPGYGAYPGVRLIHSVTLCWRKLILPSPAGANYK